MFDRILITTDFSEASRAPFRTAAALAKKFNSTPYLLHVALKPQIYTPWQIADETPEELRRRKVELERRLEAFRAREEAFDGLLIQKVVLMANSIEELGEFQRKMKITLLLIATHGFSNLRHFQMGSFTSKVFPLVACPVLVFRSFDGPHEAPHEALVPHRILVPYDFSTPSERCLQAAGLWARKFNSSVRLLSVIQPNLTLLGDSPVDDAYPEGIGSKHQDDVLNRLEGMIKADWTGIQVQPAVRVGHPALEILKEAEDFQPDLIIQASRGLSLPQVETLGSVAEKTIHGAHCPVLVVKYAPVWS